MTFELQHTDTASDARAGIITTDHGQIQTPIFMPVGTAGTVKGVHFSELRDQVKAQIIYLVSISFGKLVDCISLTRGIALSSPTVAAFRCSL